MPGYHMWLYGCHRTVPDATCLSSGLFCWTQSSKNCTTWREIVGHLFQTACSASCKQLRTKLLSVASPPPAFVGSVPAQQKNAAPFLQTYETFPWIFPETFSLLLWEEFVRGVGKYEDRDLRSEQAKKEIKAWINCIVSFWDNGRPGQNRSQDYLLLFKGFIYSYLMKNGTNKLYEKLLIGLPMLDK